MRVADGADAVRGRLGGRREDAGELLACGGRGAVHVLEVDRVQGAADGPQDVPAPGALDGQFLHQLAQHLQVLDEVPDVLVEDREVHPGEGVLRFVARGVLVSERRRQEGVVVEDDRVGGRLDVQQHFLAALGGCTDAHPLVARVETLHRGAVGAVDEALALEARHVLVEAEVEQRLDGPARPGLGDRTGDPEPAGAPRSAPPVADRDRLRRTGQSLRDGDGLTRCVPDGDVQRDGFRIYGRPDALVENALQTGFDQAAVVVHEGGSVVRWVRVGGDRGGVGGARVAYQRCAVVAAPDVV